MIHKLLVPELRNKHRISNQSYFLNIAKAISEKSTCIRHKVGCIIIDNDNTILATGYNGAPRGDAHCIDIGCIRDLNNIDSGKNHEMCRAIHAEQNAIINAARKGTSIKDGICYCTHKPCIICLKMLINAGIKEIYYENEYKSDDYNIINIKNIKINRIS